MADLEPQGREPNRWTGRQQVIVAVFLLFAAAAGAALGYLAYWAQQEAGAGLVEDGGAPASTGLRPQGSAVPLHPGERAGGEPGEEPEPGEPAGDEAGGEPGEEEPAGHAPDRPRIAIVIDDWGYDWSAAPGFLDFPARLTVAVLPFLPHSVEQAEKALAAGHEVIVHMPMEPLNGALDIGPGGVYVGMDEEAIARAVREALAAVPGAVGLNNHMGSRATAEPAVMRAVLRVLKEEGKFFVDSYTTAATVGPAVARELGVPFAVNQVFLDHESDEEYVKRQIRRLANLARQRGYAVGIGHVRPHTYRALAEMLPELLAEGFEFVTLSEVLSIPEGTWVASAAPSDEPPDSTAASGAAAPAAAPEAWSAAMPAAVQETSGAELPVAARETSSAEAPAALQTSSAEDEAAAPETLDAGLPSAVPEASSADTPAADPAGSDSPRA